MARAQQSAYIKLNSKDIIATASNDYNLTAKNNISVTSSGGNILNTIGDNTKSYKIIHGANGNNILLDQDKYFVGTTNNHLRVNVSDSDMDTASELIVNSPIILRSKTDNINIQTNHAGGQIILTTYPSAIIDDDNFSTRISMTSATDGTSMITMIGGGGANLNLKTFVASDGSDVNGKAGVQIAPLLVAQSQVITGHTTFPDGNYSLIVQELALFRSNLKVNGAIDIDGTLHIAGQDQSGYGVWAEHKIGSNVELTAPTVTGTNVNISSALKVGNKGGMNESWFNGIQNLYNNWRGGNFPRTDSEIQSLARGAVTIPDVSVYIRRDEHVWGVYTVSGAFSQFETAVNNLEGRVQALENK